MENYGGNEGACHLCTEYYGQQIAYDAATTDASTKRIRKKNAAQRSTKSGKKKRKGKKGIRNAISIAIKRGIKYNAYRQFLIKKKKAKSKQRKPIANSLSTTRTERSLPVNTYYLLVRYF